MIRKPNKSKKKKFKKAKYKVTNWSEYNDALRKRGDITIWITDDAINKWHPIKEEGARGRPKLYSEYAIECCLMLRQVYNLPLRQTQGFVSSLITLMDINISSPDYTTLSKRSLTLELESLASSIEAGSHILVDSTGLKVYGKDEWHQEKHLVDAKRTWRKLHLAIDENHQIIAEDLTDKSVGDPTALPGLLNQVDSFQTFMADGAYDGDPLYKQILEKQSNAEIIIPPPKNAASGSSNYEQRNNHTEFIKQHGKPLWKVVNNYGLRSLVELAMLRYKTIIGPKLKAREIGQQKTEAEVSVRVLNRMTKLGMPISVKVQ